MIARAIAICVLTLSVSAAGASDPIVNASTEQSQLIGTLPDGGLPPVLGVQNIEVFRASHADAETAWTYNHHMDLAQWRGRMYLAWTNGQRDEDVWPSHELYVTSQDGFHWSKPAELFPQGDSISLRMYFFHAPNDRMLAIAGLRTSTAKLSEASQGGLVVRQILPDHTLGGVFLLRDGPAKAMIPQPWFETSSDTGFVEACHQLLANHTFLEQQDFGVLLGKDRMSVYGSVTESFGKAFCFFHRKDGALVGVAKKGWTVISTNEGKSWSKPVILASIHTDNGKEWVQRTSDGRYAYIYNPQATDRFPLVLMTSDDGVTFSNMRVVHGEVPLKRYDGSNKNIGPQYVRGISEWATDGMHIQGPAAADLWIVYSSNKEDIWVSRIPIPVTIARTGPVHDRFDDLPAGDFVPNWNTYSPKWGGVRIVDAADGKALELEDRDPYDYAKAERVFAPSAHLAIHFQLMVQQVAAGGMLDIELRSAFRTDRPVRLTLGADGRIKAMDGLPDLGAFAPGRWVDVQIRADSATEKYVLMIDEKAVASFGADVPPAALQRLTFRTGPFRSVDKGPFPDPDSDRPIAPSTFLIRNVDIH
jgi:hypothetical protein